MHHDSRCRWCGEGSYGKDHIIWHCREFSKTWKEAAGDLDIEAARSPPGVIRKGIPPAMEIHTRQPTKPNPTNRYIPAVGA